MDPNKDIDSMSMDELRQLVEQNFELPAPESAGEADQPRDDQGRFAKPEPKADEEVVYQRVIDLGDGSGVQIFEGKTYDELIDKLAKAQEHATRKIREQAAALKSQPKPEPPKPVEQPLSEGDKWLLQQRMLNEPEKVIEEFVQRKVSALEQARADAERAAATRQAEIENQAEEWVAAHPDYYASEKNGKKIEKWLKVNSLDPTPDNYSQAFEDLNESGLLEGRPNETPVETEEAPAAKRIVDPAPVVTTVRRKVVGGISTKRSAPAERTAPGLTEDELYKMPMAELERLAFQHLRS